MRLLCLAAVAAGCGGKATEAEPSVEPAPLGKYSPASIDYLSKSCRGAVTWSGEKSFTCLTGEKPIRYYSVAFDVNGVITGIHFSLLDAAETRETYDRSIASIVDESVRDVLRSSIPTLGESMTILGPRLAGSARVWANPDGSPRRSVSWHYSPIPTEPR